MLCEQYISCSTMTQCRIKTWNKKIIVGPVKLYTIPPTTENIKHAHHQVAQWREALRGEPPSLSAVDLGFEAHTAATGDILIPRPLSQGTKDAPDKVREMIHCRCDASQCKGKNCKCSTIGCTIFSKCESGPNCLNPLTKNYVITEEEYVLDTGSSTSGFRLLID